MFGITFDDIRPFIVPVIYAVVIVAVLPLMAGYIVLLERKVMAHMQARMGPMRVGPHGLLQPIADAVKLLLKEDITPKNADAWMFWLAPLLSVTMALLAYAALPLGPAFQIADLDVGLLFILAISSLGIYGIVLGGWASNSHYSLLGALRSAAQLVSYETAAGLALVSGLLLGGTLSMKGLVEAQDSQGVWFIFVAPFSFFIYLIASIAETNRAPFDLPEAESELVAGYMTEYSGFRWSLYFLAEYANMIVVSGIAVTLFLGGWMRPLSGVHAHIFGLPYELLDLLPALIFLRAGGVVHETRAASGRADSEDGDVFVRRAVRGARRGDGVVAHVAVVDAGNSRRVLVHCKSARLLVRIPVVPVYVPALPLRSTDETRLAIPDSVGAGKSGNDRHRDRSGAAIRLAARIRNDRCERGDVACGVLAGASGR